MTSVTAAQRRRRPKNVTIHGTRRSDRRSHVIESADLPHPVASYLVILAMLLERWMRILTADVGRERTAGDETTFGCGIDRLRDPALDLNGSPLIGRVRDRHRKSTRLNS